MADADRLSARMQATRLALATRIAPTLSAPILSARLSAVLPQHFHDSVDRQGLHSSRAVRRRDGLEHGIVDRFLRRLGHGLEEWCQLVVRQRGDLLRRAAAAATHGLS